MKKYFNYIYITLLCCLLVACTIDKETPPVGSSEEINTSFSIQNNYNISTRSILNDGKDNEITNIKAAIYDDRGFFVKDLSTSYSSKFTTPLQNGKEYTVFVLVNFGNIKYPISKMDMLNLKLPFQSFEKMNKTGMYMAGYKKIKVTTDINNFTIKVDRLFACFQLDFNGLYENGIDKVKISSISAENVADRIYPFKKSTAHKKNSLKKDNAKDSAKDSAKENDHTARNKFQDDIKDNIGKLVSYEFDTRKNDIKPYIYLLPNSENKIDIKSEYFKNNVWHKFDGTIDLNKYFTIQQNKRYTLLYRAFINSGEVEIINWEDGGIIDFPIATSYNGSFDVISNDDFKLVVEQNGKIIWDEDNSYDNALKVNYFKNKPETITKGINLITHCDFNIYAIKENSILGERDIAQRFAPYELYIVRHDGLKKKLKEFYSYVPNIKFFTYKVDESVENTETNKFVLSYDNNFRQKCFVEYVDKDNEVIPIENFNYSLLNLTLGGKPRIKLSEGLILSSENELIAEKKTSKGHIIAYSSKNNRKADVDIKLIFGEKTEKRIISPYWRGFTILKDFKENEYSSYIQHTDLELCFEVFLADYSLDYYSLLNLMPEKKGFYEISSEVYSKNPSEWSELMFKHKKFSQYAPTNIVKSMQNEEEFWEYQNLSKLKLDFSSLIDDNFLDKVTNGLDRSLKLYFKISLMNSPKPKGIKPIYYTFDGWSIINIFEKENLYDFRFEESPKLDLDIITKNGKEHIFKLVDFYSLKNLQNCLYREHDYVSRGKGWIYYTDKIPPFQEHVFKVNF